MSQPGLHKLERIAAYVLQRNVPQPEMQAQYEAARIINRIMKEIQFGLELKRSPNFYNPNKRKKR